MSNLARETKVSISLEELEEIVRKVVNEEVTKIFSKKFRVFVLPVGSPLYKDMEDIITMKEEGKTKIYSREEAFS